MSVHPYDASELKEVERRLRTGLADLTTSLTRHDRETVSRLPGDSEDSVPFREELLRIELEEMHERAEIRLYKEALERLEAGTYGICLKCYERISKVRLAAVPYARYCLECQKKGEEQRARVLHPIRGGAS